NSRDHSIVHRSIEAVGRSTRARGSIGSIGGPCMATRIQIVFDCADPARQAEFWRQALGYRYPDPPEGFASWEAWARQTLPEDQWNAASALVDPDGIGPRLYFQRVPEPRVAKNRVHLDLNVSTPGASLEERKAQ